MRVHPTLLTRTGPRRGLRWVAAGLLCLLLLSMLYPSKPSTQVVQAPAPAEKMIDVVVAIDAVQPGEMLEDKKFKIEPRVVKDLAANVVTSLESLRGKVATSAIPKGYAVVADWLAEPVQVEKAPPEISAEKVVDPRTILYEQIRGETSEVPVIFPEGRPRKGSRIAIGVVSDSDKDNGVIMVIDEAWVLDYGDDNSSVLVRVKPEKAFFLRSVVNLASNRITYIGLADSGQSLYQGKTVDSLSELKKLLNGNHQATVSPKSENDDVQFKNYAWVTGTAMKYGIDEHGQIFYVDENGKKVDRPLPWRAK